MNTWNSGSWTISAGFCYIFSSMISVHVPLPCLNLFKVSSKVMILRSLLFTIDAHTFQMTSTNPMTIYLLPPLGISTIVVHVNASGVYPSWNATFIILTSLSHFLVSGPFSFVDSLSHVFRCYVFIPNGPTARPVHSFLTANAITSPLGACPQY